MAKKKRSDDSVTIVGPDGEETVVPRGDLDDKQWAAVKAQVSDQPQEDPAALAEAKKKAEVTDPSVDGTDPIFAQKKKASAADHTGEDFMEVKGADGQKVTVMRGPLDDVTWNEQVSQAKKNGRLINSVETVPPTAIPKEDPAGGGGSLYSRMKSTADKLFEGATPAEKGKKAAQPLVDIQNGTDAPDDKAVAYGNEQGGKLRKIFDAEEGQSDAGTKSRESSDGGVKLDFSKMKASHEVPTVQLDKNEQDPGLTKLQQEKTSLADEGLRTESSKPKEEPGFMSAMGENVDLAGKGLKALVNPARSAASAALNAGGQGMGGLTGMGMQALGSAIAPPAAPPDAAQADYDAWRTGGGMERDTAESRASWAAANKLAAAMPKPGAPVPPAGAGGSSGGSMKMSSSGGPPAGAVPPMPDRSNELDMAFSDADAARQRSAQLASDGLKDQARIQEEGRLHDITQQHEMMASQERMNSAKMQAQQAYAKTVDQMTAPGKIDPDRWWNARGPSRQIFVVLSAALTRGATLGMFQHAIDQDIAAQQHDIENAHGAMQAKASGQFNMMRMARENGLDEFEAQKATKAFYWDQIFKQAKVAEMNTSSQVIKTNAMETGAIAQQNKIKEEAGLDQHRQMLALEQEKMRMQAAHNKSMEGAAWTKANQQKAPKPGKALEPAIKQNLTDMQNGITAIEQMQKVLGPESSIIGGIADEGLKHIPKTAANRKSKALEPLLRKAIRGIDKSTITASDQEYWKGKLSTVGTGNWTQDDMKALHQLMSQEYTNALDINRKAGSNVSGFDGAVVPSEEAPAGFQPEEE